MMKLTDMAQAPLPSMKALAPVGSPTLLRQAQDRPSLPRKRGERSEGGGAEQTNRYASSTLMVLAALLLTGCGNDEFQDLQDFVKDAGKDLRGKISAPPEVRPYEPFVYNNDAGLPDPFKVRKPDLRTGGRTGSNQPDLFRPKEALEEFPLEGLKMVGYLYLKKVAHAVISAPDGKLHRVKVGNYAGLNFGKIQEVTEEEVIIKEMVQDSTGDWAERLSTLKFVE